MCRHLLISMFALCLSLPSPLWARLRVPPGEEDVRRLAEPAPLVFRGEVVRLNLTRSDAYGKQGIAVIAVDRWYRGAQSADISRVQVHFAYGLVFLNGHDCVDLVLKSHWIFFAKPHDSSSLALFDDCEGALRVSSLLASRASVDFLLQIEADTRAGLSDSDSEARVASIQRLAGLGLTESRDALHRVITSGTEEESKWAMYAAIKTGDVSVLTLAMPMLLSLRHKEAEQHRQPDGMLVTVTTPYPQPEAAIALAIEKLRTPDAVPALIELLNMATDDLVRSCASQALMEIRDPRALAAFANHLKDSSQYVRYNSLIGIEYITREPACTIAKPENAERAELSCKAWWDARR